MGVKAGHHWSLLKIYLLSFAICLPYWPRNAKHRPLPGAAPTSILTLPLSSAGSTGRAARAAAPNFASTSHPASGKSSPELLQLATGAGCRSVENAHLTPSAGVRGCGSQHQGERAAPWDNNRDASEARWRCPGQLLSLTKHRAKAITSPISQLLGFFGDEWALYGVFLPG